MYGLPTPRTITVDGAEVKVTDYGDNMQIPYLGLGFLVRYQEDGVVTYEPTVLPKVRFATEGLSAETQEEEIDWQTRELSAEIMRDDSPNHNWKWIAEAQTTEAAAEKVLRAMLGITEEPAPEVPASNTTDPAETPAVQTQAVQNDTAAKDALLAMAEVPTNAQKKKASGGGTA